MCDNLKQVMLPSNTAWIGDEAFRFCSQLENVIIFSDDVLIGNNCFFGCPSLKTVYLTSKALSKNSHIIEDSNIQFLTLDKMPLDLFLEAGKSMKEINTTITEEVR